MMEEVVGEARSDGKVWSEEEILRLKNLLQSLDNAESRKISLLEIRELVNSHKDLAVANVQDVLFAVCALIVDIDDEVRKETLNILSCLFTRVPVIQMGYHLGYTLIRTSISNAATHLDQNVQIDSLKLINLVSDFYPLALCNSKSIFNCFLHLISCTKVTRSKSSEGKQLSTSNNKIPPQDWKVDILQSLLKFLFANISLMTEENNDCPPIYKFDTNKYSMVIEKHFSIEPEISMMGSYTLEDSFMYTNEEFLQYFFNQVLVFSCYTWEEAVPWSVYSKCFGVEKSESIITHRIILQVVNNINEWVMLLCKKNLSKEFLVEFKDLHSDTFQIVFLRNFPYYLAPKNLTINLTICKVCAMMNMGNLYRRNALPFLLETIDLEGLDEDNLTCLLKTLKLLITNNECLSELESHLEHVFLLYQRTGDGNVRRNVGNFLASLVLDPTFYLHNESHTLELFLGHLIEVFFTAVNEETLDDDFISMLKKMAVRGITAFIASLQTNVEALIALLLHKNESVQDISAFLITKIHNFTAEMFYKLSTTFYDSASVFHKAKYIISAFNSRVCFERDLGFRIEDYYSFLFNIIVIDDSDIHKCSEIFPVMQQLHPKNFSNYFIVPTTKWETHRNVVDTVMTMFSQLPCKEDISLCIQRLLKLFLLKNTEMSTHTVHAIFHLYSISGNVGCDKIDVDACITKLILSCCMYETSLCDLGMSKENLSRYSVLNTILSVEKSVSQFATSWARFFNMLRSLERKHNSLENL